MRSINSAHDDAFKHVPQKSLSESFGMARISIIRLCKFSKHGIEPYTFMHSIIVPYLRT